MATATSVCSTDGVSERLEFVRESEGLKLKPFWRKLRDNGGLELSYVAARNYHYDREPPLSYVVAVSEVYGVSLDWLATGKGEVYEDGKRDAEDFEAESWAVLRRIKHEVDSALGERG